MALDADPDRVEARKRLEARRGFVSNAVAYVVINAFLIGIWAFTGFAGLLPLLLAALFWRRSTAVGGIASILTALASWAWFLVRGWHDSGYTVGGTGLMPVVVVLAASTMAMVVASLCSPAPARERVDRFLPAADRGAPKHREAADVPPI